MKYIYLDNCATTQLDERVFSQMLPFLTGKFGNAASKTHALGWEAAEAVKDARQKICTLLSASDPANVLFTSGATESIELALKVLTRGKKKGQIIVSQIEHPAVFSVARGMELLGYKIVVAPVNRSGILELETLSSLITDETILVSVMTANNEIGTIQDVEGISRVCRSRGVLFHTDATQAIGKIPFNMSTVVADAVSFTGHKIYGPKGCGALILGSRFMQTFDSEDPQKELRPGTMNVPGIVGLAAALELCVSELEVESSRLLQLRDLLWDGIQKEIGSVTLNGCPIQRVPGVLNVRLENIDSDALMMELSDVAISAGSACSSARSNVSHVLLALGLTEVQARSALRFGIGRFNDQAEIEYVVKKLSRTAHRLRRMSPAIHNVHASEKNAPGSVSGTL